MFKKLLNFIFPQKQAPIPFHQGFDLTGLPIITLHQGENKINFLLDTGATSSVIDTAALKDLDYEIVKGKKVPLSGIEGNVQHTDICIVGFSYKNNNYESTFLACDMSAAFDRIKANSGVIIHGLLGSDFFHRFRYVLDFAELIAYSKK